MRRTAVTRIERGRNHLQGRRIVEQSTRAEKGTSVRLEVDGVKKYFGGVDALKGVSFVADDATVTTVLGPNGAGKTTLFNVITGVLTSSGGTVRAGDRDISNWSTHAIARHGVVRTFQKLRLFDNLSVSENVAVAAHSVGSCGWFAALLGRRLYRQEMQLASERAAELLGLVGLSARETAAPSDLPQGEKRLLEIARAIALDPKVLLLDEPMAGLDGTGCQAVAGVVARLRDSGMTVVMIEHHVDHALSVSDHVVVMNFGEKIFDGTPSQARRDHAVRAAYLGGAQVEEAS